MFDSFFEGGNLDCVMRVGEREYDCFMRVDSNTWRRLPGTVTTDAKGVWTRKVKPAVNFKYRALSLSPTIAGKDSFGGWSSQVDVGVKPAISLRFSKNPSIALIVQ